MILPWCLFQQISSTFHEILWPSYDLETDVNFNDFSRAVRTTPSPPGITGLTHWGWVTHICVIKLTIIASDNGLPPSRHQDIIWTNAGILLIRSLGTNFSEILIKIHTFSFKKLHLKLSSAKWRPFCLGLDVLNLVNAWLSWNPQMENWIWYWVTVCVLRLGVFWEN